MSTTKKRRGRSPRQSDPPECISFRLDPDYNEMLALKAEELGVSPHKLARTFVLDALGMPRSISDIVELLSALVRKHSETHAALCTSVEALLVSAGKVPEKEAAQWSKEAFNLAE